MSPWSLETERLTLRPWSADDAEPFAGLNQDPQVMEFLGGPQSREISNAALRRFMQEHEDYGYCPWAAESRLEGTFLGFIGLHNVPKQVPFAPAVEVGWRLRPDAWGRGFATEGALAALDFAFTVINLDEVVSMTATLNEKSQRVMQRLGMYSCAEDNFDHPLVKEDSPLHPHVLYRLSNPG